MEPLKKREERTRQKRDEGASQQSAAKPKEVTNIEDEEESTTRDVQHVMKHVVQACHREGRVGYFHLLMDPNSFAKSVENMFHFTFLIKDGRVGIKIGEDGLPYIFLRK